MPWLYDLATAAVAGPLSLVSPGRAALYRHHRRMYRSYVAGSTSGPSGRYQPRRTSADDAVRRDLSLIVARCRDQAANNPYISGNLNRIVNNAVRRGIRPQWRLRRPDGSLDRDGSRAWERLHARWARRAHAGTGRSLWHVQRLCLRHMWTCGGLLLHRVHDDSIPGVPPLRIETLEIDHLDERVDGDQGGGRVARRGIEYDRRTGEPVAYHLLPVHPGDRSWTDRRDTVRVPARDIIHVHEQQRASQSIGVPWIVAVVMEAYELEDYRFFERTGAKLAAAFGIFVRQAFPEGGPGMGFDPTGEGVPSWDDVPDYIEPGRIQGLPPGTEVTIASHNRPGSQYEPYVRESRRSQSVGAGISYESYANDYSDASYSSARSSALEERLSYRGMQAFLEEVVLDRVAAWFIESAWLSGLAPTPMPGYAADPWPWHEMVTWQEPGWGWVDPLKDGQASRLRVEEVLSTRRREAQQQGYDWEEILEEAMEEERMLGELRRLRQEAMSAEQGTRG